MRILITGGTGFLGKSLVPLLADKGYNITLIARSPTEAIKQFPNISVIQGDICQPGLGVKIDESWEYCINLAAKLSFRPKDREEIFATNYRGTLNVLNFCASNRIPKLFHVSTAYLFGQNHYEISKKLAEDVVQGQTEIKTTILRPSILIGDTKVEGLPPVSGFYLGIRAFDQAKRWFERGTKLPPLTFKIRVAGNPQGRLNLIPVDIVAQNIVRLVEQDAEGIYHLTHPAPPTLKDLEQPISLSTGADVEFLSIFTPNVGDRLVARLITGLSPYLCGHDLPSDIECPSLTADFLRRTAEAFLNKS